jgi:hypothetical protein
MSLKRHIGIVGLTLLMCGSLLYPCDMVVIGGVLPPVVTEVTGTVIGSWRMGVVGSAVPGATVSVQTRTDTEFFKKGEVKYPRGTKPSGGNLKNWQCGSEISKTQTDRVGYFTMSVVKPGKYCLDIVGPPPTDVSTCVHNGQTDTCAASHASFVVDVAESAAKATLIADISQQWPDCSGGSSLKLRAAR